MRFTAIPEVGITGSVSLILSLSKDEAGPTAF
jgi:hypothetical protein